MNYIVTFYEIDNNGKPIRSEIQHTRNDFPYVPRQGELIKGLMNTYFEVIRVVYDDFGIFGRPMEKDKTNNTYIIVLVKRLTDKDFPYMFS